MKSQPAPRPETALVGSGRRTTIVALCLFGLGIYLAWDAWSSGSLWRYQLVGYCVASLLAVPLLTRLCFGRRVHRFWRRIAFLAVPLGVCLLLAEGVFRLLAPARDLPIALARDPGLGHVMVAGTGGTDARGFRNPESLERCDILVIGDSQTWGFAIAMDETYSAALASSLGVSTYQMSNGSYGPVQYRELLRRGLPLQPKLVVVAVYFGNDLVDAADYTGLVGAESIRLDGVPTKLRENDQFGGDDAPNQTMACIDGVFAASYLLDSAADVVKSRLLGGSLDAQAGTILYEHATAGTVLQPEYRFPAVNPASGTVKNGIAITDRCFKDLAAQCAERDVPCVMLAIPTKEYVYSTWFTDLGQEQDKAMKALAMAEQSVRAQVFAAARRAGIQVADMTGPILAAMNAGQMPWFGSGDGHINAVGHQIAATVLRPYWVR